MEGKRAAEEKEIITAGFNGVDGRRFKLLQKSFKREGHSEERIFKGDPLSHARGTVQGENHNGMPAIGEEEMFEVKG